MISANPRSRPSPSKRNLASTVWTASHLAFTSSTPPPLVPIARFPQARSGPIARFPQARSAADPLLADQLTASTSLRPLLSFLILTRRLQSGYDYPIAREFSSLCCNIVGTVL